MTTIINADTSTGGAIITGDSSGALQLQGGGTPRLTMNTSGALGVGSSPSYGTSGQVLTSNGSGASPTWASASAGGFSSMSVITSSSTFTIPSGITTIKVTVVGGGGGCGYGGQTAGGTTSVASGTQTISTISATGGNPGNDFYGPGYAGTGSGGTINFNGNGGGSGANAAYTGGGSGGGSFFGGGGSGGYAGYQQAGTAYGGGGGGGRNLSDQAIAGGGGGGGAIKYLTSLTPGNTLSVTIGAGGSAGSGGTAGYQGVVVIEY